MTFQLRVPGDGDWTERRANRESPTGESRYSTPSYSSACPGEEEAVQEQAEPREFEIVPEKGTVPPQSEIKVREANLCRSVVGSNLVQTPSKCLRRCLLCVLTQRFQTAACGARGVLDSFHL